MSTTTKKPYKELVTWLAERGMSYEQWMELPERDGSSYIRAWLSDEDADGRTVQQSMQQTLPTLGVATNVEPFPKRVEDAERERFKLFSDRYSVFIFVAAIVIGGYFATTAPEGYWMDFLRGLLH